MGIEEWIKKHNIPVVYRKGEYLIQHADLKEDWRTEMHHLSDYYVSAKDAGWGCILLVKRTSYRETART